MVQRARKDVFKGPDSEGARLLLQGIKGKAETYKKKGRKSDSSQVWHRRINTVLSFNEKILKQAREKQPMLHFLKWALSFVFYTPMGTLG